MISAISLCQTDAVDDNGYITGQQIYTSRVALFGEECDAFEFVDGKDHMMLVDCDTGYILKPAFVIVGE